MNFVRSIRFDQSSTNNFIQLTMLWTTGLRSSSLHKIKLVNIFGWKNVSFSIVQVALTYFLLAKKSIVYVYNMFENVISC